jgi:hypothetical protein
MLVINPPKTPLRKEGADDDKRNRGRTDKPVPDESDVPNSRTPKHHAKHDGELVWSEDVETDERRMVYSRHVKHAALCKHTCGPHKGYCDLVI